MSTFKLEYEWREVLIGTKKVQVRDWVEGWETIDKDGVIYHHYQITEMSHVENAIQKLKVLLNNREYIEQYIKENTFNFDGFMSAPDQSVALDSEIMPYLVYTNGLCSNIFSAVDSFIGRPLMHKIALEFNSDNPPDKFGMNWAVIYPIELRSAKYDFDSKHCALYLNPRRWEYIQFVHDELKALL